MSAREPRHAVPVKKKNIKSKIVLLVIFILIGVIGFAAYKFLSESIQLNHEKEQFDSLRDLIVEDDPQEEATDPDPDSTSPDGTSAGAAVKAVRNRNYDKLFAMNEDMRGWMWIDDSAIDYPVMKNDLENGEYYLHRDFYGDYSYAGSLFIGRGCDYDSNIFIVYGHNMNNGSMFGTLMEYSDYSYAMSHRDIHLDTKTEHRVYRVFAAFDGEIYPDSPKYDGYFKYYENIGDFGEDYYYSILNTYRGMSYYWTDDAPSYPDQIMLMSTCYYDNVRFVVAAYRVK